MITIEKDLSGFKGGKKAWPGVLAACGAGAATFLLFPAVPVLGMFTGAASIISAINAGEKLLSEASQRRLAKLFGELTLKAHLSDHRVLQVVMEVGHPPQGVHFGKVQAELHFDSWFWKGNEPSANTNHWTGSAGLEGASFVAPDSRGLLEANFTIPEWQDDWNAAEQWHWHLEVKIELLEPGGTEKVSLWLPAAEMQAWLGR